MKRIVQSMLFAVIVALLVNAANAGDRFSPRDRQHPGKTFYATRLVKSPVSTPATSIPTESGVFRSFSFEPGAAAPMPAAKPAPTVTHRKHRGVWERRLHPGVL